MDNTTTTVLVCPMPVFRILFLVLAGCLLSYKAMTQNDTTLLLRAEQLTAADVDSFVTDKNKAIIRSATRSNELPGDLPFTTWVITSDDILRYGFVTLADVLKAAPGIRVSQPGNAVEGETFMMRGLSGNQYVKIMINDVPVKPSGALGMPIGAQLPIREAERIEVMYGPSGGMMFGNEACAGVVNIIIKETERPIFTQADLSFGKYGYNSLDLMFGGKIFKGRNIVRFSLYGSSTVRAQTGIFWDTTVLNTSNYLVNGLNSTDLFKFPHYRGESNTDYNYTLTTPAAHDSRLFGLQMRWRGVSFSYHRMTREDVTFLGMSPLAISYSSPGNFHKDRIDTYALSCWKRTKRAYFSSTWSMINYLVGDNSSANYVFDELDQLSFIGQKGPSLNSTDKEMLLNYDFFKYNSNSRFRYSRNFDLKWDAFYRWRIWNKLWITNGIQSSSGSGLALLTRHYLPPQDRVFFPESGNYNGPFQSRSYVYFQNNLYANLDWQGKKLRVMAGIGAVAPGFMLNPRVAALYHIDSSLVVFMNASGSVKRIHPYQANYAFYFDSINQQITNSRYTLSNDPAEKVNAAEFGLRFRKSEVSFFYQNAYGLVRDGYLVNEQNGNYSAGFKQNTGLSHRLWGIQGRFVSDATIPYKMGGEEEGVLTWRNEYYAQYSRGEEWFGYGFSHTDEIRNYPRWITQFRSSVRNGRWQLMAASNRQTSVLSKAVTYQAAWDRNTFRERYPVFRTWDTMVSFYLNKNFVLYINVINAFNKKSYGLDAYGTPDDAFAPVQQRRLFRFGINYNMN